MSYFNDWFASDRRVASLPSTTQDQIKDILRHTFEAGRQCERDRKFGQPHHGHADEHTVRQMAHDTGANFDGLEPNAVIDAHAAASRVP